MVSKMFEEYAARLCMNCANSKLYNELKLKPTEITADICWWKLEPFTSEDEDCPYFKPIKYFLTIPLQQVGVWHNASI